MYIKDLLVLYVCEETSNKDFIGNILNENVNQMLFASTSEEAYKKYKEFSPCLIIVEDDFSSSKMLDLFRQIRLDDIKTAFIVISSNKENPYFLDLMELYLTKYILKPFKNDILLDALQKAMEIIDRRVNSHVKLGKGIVFNFENQSIIRGDEIFVLNKKESLLVDLFIKNQTRVISYEEIEYHIWNNQNTKAALKSLIRDFRKKTYKDILINYSGTGYQLQIN